MGDAEAGGLRGLSAAGLLAALVFARPELVALTAPFLLALAAGLALATPPQLQVHVELDQDRALEDDEVGARIVVESATPSTASTSTCACPRGSRCATARTLSRFTSRRESAANSNCSSVRAAGAVMCSGRRMRARGILSASSSWETVAPGRPELRVYPREDVLRRVLQPRETQVFSGNEVSRHKGEGIKFADIRPWFAGDPLKRVNWRASARRGELWVNESHPERNTDVILFRRFICRSTERRRRDTRSRGSRDGDARERVRRATRSRRAGFIEFGGILRWLVPGMGTVQLLSDRRRAARHPGRALVLLERDRRDPAPHVAPEREVIALSPLLDGRSVGALLDLRARGYDLTVIDVSPVPFTPRPAAGLDSVAYDIWTLRRDALRHRLQSAGVAVAEWRGDTPLQAVLEEVREFRRYARHAHV